MTRDAEKLTHAIETVRVAAKTFFDRACLASEQAKSHGVAVFDNPQEFPVLLEEIEYEAKRFAQRADRLSALIAAAICTEPDARQKAGKTRIGYSIMADNVVALRQPPRERNAGQDRHQPRAERDQMDRYGGGDGQDHFDDEMPF